MTANVMQQDREDCQAAGMDDYVGKPIRVEELVAALNRCSPLALRSAPVVPASSSSILDPGALDKLLKTVDGDDEFLAELLDTFFQDAPQLLEAMQRATEQGDAQGLRIAAHSLKSNSAEFGALNLSELCRELEQAAKINTLDGATHKVAQAQSEYGRVQAALQALHDPRGDS
jgi:HPt (histidine-containing phosphotransfer) domain-containing protein